MGHLENLLAPLRMVGERPVRKAKRLAAQPVAKAVDHATPVQRPEPEVTNEHGDNIAGRNRGRGWPHLDPVEVKVLPRHEGCLRAFENFLPVTDGHGCLVEVVPRRRGLCDTNFSVRERQVPRFFNEAFDCWDGRPAREEHVDQPWFTLHEPDCAEPGATAGRGRLPHCATADA